MAEALTFEPDELVAGDTASWRRSFDLYPAGDGWKLSYALVQHGDGTQIAFEASADGQDFVVNVPAATTVAWQPGKYSGQGYVSNGTDRFRVWEGQLTILQNFAGPGAKQDPRSHAQKVLDAISAVLEGRASKELQEFTVEGVVLRRASVNDLLTLRDRYVVILRKEEDAQKIRSGKRTGRRILTRFTNANRGRFGTMGQVGDIR